MAYFDYNKQNPNPANPSIMPVPSYGAPPAGGAQPQPFQNTAYGYLNQAAQNALPSPESMDRASARLRSRVDSQTQANQQGIQDKYVGRGLGASGMHEQALGQNRAAGLASYGVGLADLQDDYWKQQQQGASILSGIGQNYGQLGLGIDQAAFNREQLAQQAEEARRNSLNTYMSNMGQYGNTAFNSAPNQTAFNQIQQMILQSLGGQYGGQQPYTPPAMYNLGNDMRYPPPAPRPYQRPEMGAAY